METVDSKASSLSITDLDALVKYRREAIMRLCPTKVRSCLCITSHQHVLPSQELNSGNRRHAHVHREEPGRPHAHPKNYKQLTTAESQRNSSFQERVHSLVIQ